VIRIFKVHYPVRGVVLLAGEALIVWLSLMLGVWTASRLSEVGFPRPALLQSRDVSMPGFWAIAVTGIVLLLSHVFDLYDLAEIGVSRLQSSGILLVLGLWAMGLSVIGYVFPRLLPSNSSLVAGLVILIFALFGWRTAYSWIVQQPYFRERVYILGTGDRAQRLLNGLRQRTQLGIEVVGWTGNVEGELTREAVATHVVGLVQEKGVHRVIVALPDRRRTLPVEELLALRLAGVKVEEATSWLERISGRIEVEHLYPSWLIFADGFRFSTFHQMARRMVNFSLALIGLLLSLPLIPFIMAVIWLDSPGPVFYHQERVGRGGKSFFCHKFRTMRKDAEADTGATWAADDDPRITRVGRLLRASRLDEIPQLWCVFQGDMNFVGPRPERPEFVEWLSKEIPYYGVRHTVRPGITGWAQVQYKYGNTLEDAREKLQYDLFYIKNASIGLDLWIMFQTIKIVMLGRGAR
jgi:sugar transferase (PEP-CTERM system associated)